MKVPAAEDYSRSISIQGLGVKWKSSLPFFVNRRGLHDPSRSSGGIASMGRGIFTLDRSLLLREIQVAFSTAISIVIRRRGCYASCANSWRRRLDCRVPTNSLVGMCMSGSCGRSELVVTSNVEAN